jgi:hypothetical protein
MGVAWEGRLTAAERRGVAGLFGFEAGEGLGFVGVLSSSSSVEGIACSFRQLVSLSSPSAFHGSFCPLQKCMESKYTGMESLLTYQGNVVCIEALSSTNNKLVQGKGRAFVIQHRTTKEGDSLRLN